MSAISGCSDSYNSKIKIKQSLLKFNRVLDNQSHRYEHDLHSIGKISNNPIMLNSEINIAAGNLDSDDSLETDEELKDERSSVVIK